MEDDRHAATVTSGRGRPRAHLADRARRRRPGAVQMLTAARRPVPAAQAHERRRRPGRRRPRHADLHLRHHRTAQGLRDHPRAISSSRCGNGDHGAARAARGSRLAAAVPAAGPRLRQGRAVRGLKSRTVLGHTPDAKHLLDDLGAFRPTFCWPFPGCSRRSSTAPGARPRAGARARSSTPPPPSRSRGARRWTQAVPAWCCSSERALFDELVYGGCGPRWGAASGRPCRAAPARRAARALLPRHRRRRVRGLRPHRDHRRDRRSTTRSAHRIGTVGRPIPGQTVRIADDGEILVRGARRLPRLLEQPGRHRGGDRPRAGSAPATSASSTTAGFLRITGRKKEILVTAGGKNVAPAVLEDRLRAHRLIGQCIVVGDRRPFIAALVTVDDEALPQWLACSTARPRGRDRPRTRRRSRAARRDRRGRRGREQGRLAGGGDPEVPDPARRLQRGRRELTPSLKLRRSVVTSRYADDIAALYSGVNQPA